MQVYVLLLDREVGAGSYPDYASAAHLPSAENNPYVSEVSGSGVF